MTDEPILTRARTAGYDRSGVTPGIAHIGVGNFHRVHQAVYLDELLDRRTDQSDWGVLGVELLGGRRTAQRASALSQQDNLYSHTVFHPDGVREWRVVGSIVGYLHGPADPAAVVRALSMPNIRVVGLTITEGGYHLDPATGEFGGDGPETAAADLAREHPETTFGVLTAALRARRDAGIGPFTVLSCDNLPGNGKAARAATLGFAEAADPPLAHWIGRNVTFPDSMVDRIAPAVDASVRDALNAVTGLPDRVPVFSEAHRQWVVEDGFCNGRPAWEEVGVEVRPDVAAFVTVKQRLLNAAHSMLAYPALLAGHTYIHEAVADPPLAELAGTFMAEDVAPWLRPPRGLSPRAYAREVLTRFGNPALPDTVARVAGDGAVKIPAFVRATADELLRGGDVRRLALLAAAFRSCVNGHDGRGGPLASEPNLRDGDWRLLRSTDPLDALEAGPFRGWGLAGHAGFVEAYRTSVVALDSEGVHAAVRRAVDRTAPGRAAGARRPGR
ncbi:mannitol dehydrogenase family protein [Streptomyces sp. NPDC005925]|uniref:mannitol dehydrogenase family protein n=1 Tax=Streptomyces sp. NPDC005925 TaxID=3157172 RepID=UPI0033F32DFD